MKLNLNHKILQLAALAALGLALPSVGQAEKVISESAQSKTVQIQVGDTLSKLAAKYLGDPMKWHALMRHNDIKTPDLIKPGVTLVIPFDLKDAKTNPAEVLFATPSEVYYNFQGDGRNLADGDFIPPEGTVSSNEGTALLRLPDKSKFHMEADSVIEMKGFFESKNEDGSSVFRAFMKSVEGRVKFEVAKVMGEGRFEVETPKGIVKVRGTEFAIEIAPDKGVKFETYKGEIAVALAGSDKEISLPAGQGAVVSKDNKVTEVKLLTTPTPGDVKASDGEQTQFQWQAVDGASEYIVYAGGDAEFSAPIKVGKTKETSLRVKKMPAGQYYWNVIAVDPNGLRSPGADPKPFNIQ